MATRKTSIMWGSNAVDLEGAEVKVGQQAPEFTAQGVDMKPVSLKDTAGKVRIFSAVPSLDTGVCDRETRRFNEEAAKLPGVEVWTVSMDLPFAMKRWCGAAGIERVNMLSDHVDGSFGKAWGVLEPGKRLFVRAVFVVDKAGVVKHAQYVPVVSDEPNYEQVLAAARALA